MKKQNGITLVALIITIIVMLLLAGISISLVTGDNGVLKQAEVAEQKQLYATAEEKIRTQCEYITEGENVGKADLSKTESNIRALNLEEVKEIIPSSNLLTVELKDGSKIEIEGIYIESNWGRRGLTSSNVIYNKKYETEDGSMWFIINSDGSFDTSWAGSFPNDIIEISYQSKTLVIGNANTIFTDHNDGSGGGLGFEFRSGNELYLYNGLWNINDLEGSIIQESNLLYTLQIQEN